MKKIVYGALIIMVAVFGFVFYRNQKSIESSPVEESLIPIKLNDVVYGSADGVPSISFEEVNTDNLGVSTPFRPSEYKTTLGQSLAEGHAGTTVVVNSITTKDDNTLDPTILGDTIVLHIAPGKTNAEIVVCTGLTTATKTFTGCTFGYRFDQNATQAANIKAHAPGETVIISDDDHYLNVQYSAIDGTNAFSGIFSISTSSADVVRLNLLNSPTSTAYSSAAGFWYSRVSGLVGFKTATSGDLQLNTDGTTFSVENPITLIAGELNLATSTYDFVLRDTTLLGLATSTISGGTASGNRIDEQWNLRWNSTTTRESLIINGNATTTGRLVIGSTAPTWPTVPTTGLWIDGNATSTGSIDLAELCFDGSDCTTKHPFRVATSTGVIGASQTGTNDLATTTIKGGALGNHGVLETISYIDYTSVGGGGSDINFELANGEICAFTNGNNIGKYRLKTTTVNSGSESSQFTICELLYDFDDTLRYASGTSAINTANDFGVQIEFEATSGSPIGNLILNIITRMFNN